MRATCLLLVASLGLWSAPSARADVDGVGLRPTELPRLQGRVQFGMAAWRPDGNAPGSLGGEQLSGASLLGDYYFGSRQITRDGDVSRFRATTGVFLGSRLGLWGGTAPAILASSLISVERHSFSLASPRLGGDGIDGGAVPYLGLGYSGSSLKGGWGFSADLGLMALNPGGALRLGRALGNLQSTEDVVREISISPVVQVGVSYSF